MKNVCRIAGLAIIVLSASGALADPLRPTGCPAGVNPPALAWQGASLEGRVQYLYPPWGGTNNLFLFQRLSDLNKLDVNTVFGVDNAWISACVEGVEYIVANTPYYGIVSDRAIKGGVTEDLLDFKSAWLYARFRDGYLDDHVPTFSYDDTGAKALQQAIWRIEGEPYTSSTLATALYNKAVAVNPQSLELVRVLNLYTYQVQSNGDVKLTALAQDQLVLMQEGFEVPSPAALGGVVALLGVTGLVGRRR
jgi:hypothetical protein